MNLAYQTCRSMCVTSIIHSDTLHHMLLYQPTGNNDESAIAVLYVFDARASAVHSLEDVISALEFSICIVPNFDVWNKAVHWGRYVIIFDCVEIDFR
jgi:hypothetical protein